MTLLTVTLNLVAFLVGIIITILNKKISNFFEQLIDLGLNYLRLSRTLYKRKTRELQEELNDFIEPERKFQEKVKLKYEYGSEPSVEWKIIMIDKNIDKERIEKSVIIQLPSKSQFYFERNVMQTKYKDALFFALSLILAQKHRKADVVEQIYDKINEKNLTNEFLTFLNILNTNTKRIALIEEARRKYKALKGEISPTAQKEFCKFVDDLNQDLIGIMTISGRQSNIDNYFLHAEALLKKYNVIYIYAKGGKKQMKLLGNLKIKIWEQFKGKFDYSDEGEYGWEDVNGKVLYKARTLVVKRKIKK